MDRNEEGRPGRNFFIGDMNTYTWNCLSWWHFPPGYLEGKHETLHSNGSSPFSHPTLRHLMYRA
jgi:hypothetical protein